MLFWFKEMLIGFAIAAPVGPIGLLCIQRTLICGLLVQLIVRAGRSQHR